MDEKLERFRSEVTQEIAHRIGELRSDIRLSYGKLDHRISALEGR